MLPSVYKKRNVVLFTAILLFSFAILVLSLSTENVITQAQEHFVCVVIILSSLAICSIRKRRKEG